MEKLDIPDLDDVQDLATAKFLLNDGALRTHSRIDELFALEMASSPQTG